MNRYLVKTHGPACFPNGVCRPDHASQWAGGVLRIDSRHPALAREGQIQDAPHVSEGDELWLWAHETRKYGNGSGLTARATAETLRQEGDRLLITLRDVELLRPPFGFRDLGREPSESRLIEFVRDFRHHTVYLIEDDDFQDFRAVVERMSAGYETERLFAPSVDWSAEVRTHGDDLRAGLRNRRISRTKVRTGQAGFRNALMTRYVGQCVITGNAIPEVLEAAHVMPHTGDPKWDHPDNGMLLRRDLHALFDASLWSVDPSSNQAVVSDRLKNSEYATLEGRKIEHQVAAPLLEVHFRDFQEADTDE